ncbi:MAG: GAF domain-containing protein, partial [Edaphobacter sp.]
MRTAANSSILRSVSPVHLAYMRNMGTLSSMSVSILCEGRLWGLISGHHSKPR